MQHLNFQFSSATAWYTNLKLNLTLIHFKYLPWPFNNNNNRAGHVICVFHSPESVLLWLLFVSHLLNCVEAFIYFLCIRFLCRTGLHSVKCFCFSLRWPFFLHLCGSSESYLMQCVSSPAEQDPEQNRLLSSLHWKWVSLPLLCHRAYSNLISLSTLCLQISYICFWTFVYSYGTFSAFNWIIGMLYFHLY